MDLLKFNRTARPVSWSNEDRELAHIILKCDPLYLRIPYEYTSDLIDYALGAGVACAGKVRAHHDCSDPLRLARLLGIRVLFDISRRATIGSFNILSSYTPNPPTIMVYENRLRLCREKLISQNRQNNIFLTNLTNICVAHEMYHHVERSTLNFINLRFKVTIVDLKIIKIQKTLTMLSEIAANAFAMSLMDLPMLPSIIHEGFED